ncbi:helix-turn-helix domain-containing protein [Otariodibacter sp.]|uniref:helix-turn-helix transcriptional regulator n=1 Tax=Otariodibacter sp. TaxID=3030919 RepID=UPI0026021A37|nr:helix-turn-helix domain-containing protein [Otariodibacter sp.]
MDITNTSQEPIIEKRYTCKELMALGGGVSRTFIYDQIKKGNLPKPEKWGRSTRWKESDVKAWLASFQPEA